MEMSTCCTCGYEWEKGKDGSHTCSEHLSKRVAELETALSNIKRHQEALTAHADQTGAWKIANKALKTNRTRVYGMNFCNQMNISEADAKKVNTALRKQREKIAVLEVRIEQAFRAGFSIGYGSDAGSIHTVDEQFKRFSEQFN